MSEFDVGADITSANTTYVNEAGVSEEVMRELSSNSDIASAISNWMQRAMPGRRRSPDIFQRQSWSGSSTNIFAQIGQCARAVEEDDILSTLADTLESLCLQRLRFEMDDPDQEDIWNQIAEDLDLNLRFRQVFRENFKASQCYVGVWWQRKTYRVRTPVLQEGDVDEKTGKRKEKGPGNRERRKAYDIIAPTGFTILDPTKVIPVGNTMFGQERFAYIASEEEERAFTSVAEGEVMDPMVTQLIEGKYKPTPVEISLMKEIDAPYERMWLFRKDSVFRICRTKADYERFAPVRLKTVLELLDLKSHIRASDRAALIGATNFIVVVKKGSDKYPARQQEIENLHEQARVVARMPILVGDHRLSVEIVTPSMDNTLDNDRYWAIDSRLVFRAVESLVPSQQDWGQGPSNNVSEHSRIIALGLEGQRNGIARAFRDKVWAVAMQKNPDLLKESPRITFTPKRVSLSLNERFLKQILELRDRGDMSRESMLEEFEYDQDVEARRRISEREIYDPVFQSSVPHSSPNSNPYSDGRKGGRPEGPGNDDERDEE